MEAERETYQSALGKKHKTNTLPEIVQSKQLLLIVHYTGDKQRILRKEKNLGKEKDAKKTKKNIANKSPILHLF